MFKNADHAQAGGGVNFILRNLHHKGGGQLSQNGGQRLLELSLAADDDFGHKNAVPRAERHM